jgi:hypothetical protein
MDLDKYKEQLRSEILEFGRVHGVRKTCREAGISHGTWAQIRWGGIVNAETLVKTLEKVKTACKVSEG